MAARAVVLSCEGPELSAAEARFFADADPWGFILFARNIVEPEQVRRLTDALRATVGRAAPVLVDQEGGRVARMRGPSWRDWPPALDECARFDGRAARVRAMHLRYALIADELRAVGIDVNCAPVLDLAGEATHPVLRNRCYGSTAEEVAAIGRAVADGLAAGGVLPVIKHMPGQGRAGLDSHQALPIVEADLETLERVDFAPFRALADLPMAMTAHVVYTALDPDAPGTQSPAVVRAIRERIRFDGLLLTDDLSMQALAGPCGQRAERALSAGCDIVLHCNARRDEMEAVVAAVPRLGGAAERRATRAEASRAHPGAAGLADLAAEFEALSLRGAHG